MSVALYRSGILPAGRNRILPPRLDEGQLFYAPLMSNLNAIGAGDTTPTFVRASVATYHNGAGEIVSVGNNVARHEGPWYLKETQRTNLAKWSEDLTNAIWDKTFGVTVAGNVFASPYVGGAVIADKIEEDGTNNYHLVIQTYTGFPGRADSVSVYVHGNERGWVHLDWWNSASGFIEVFFNTATGAFGTINVTGGADSVTIRIAPHAEQMTNGWWRLGFSVQTGANTARAIEFGPAQADNVATYVGTVGWGAYFIGAQTEAGNPTDGLFVSSYIPTAAATVTRAQDVLTYPAPGNTPTGAVGSIECEFRNKHESLGGDPGSSALSTQNVVNQHGAEILFGAANAIGGNVISNAAQQVVSDGVAIHAVDHHALWAFRPFSAGLYLDSALVASAATGSNLATHSSITIGAAGSLGNGFNGWIRNVKIWETRLTP